MLHLIPQSGRVPACIRALAVVALLCCPGRPAIADEVAPGVDYEYYRLDTPNDVYVVSIERDRPEYHLMIGWPHGVRNFPSKQTTSEIASLYNRPPACDVIAAVNASFFGDVPTVIGPTANGGELLEPPRGSLDTLILGAAGSRIVEDLAPMASAVEFADGVTTPLDGCNRKFAAGEVVAYTESWGRLAPDPPPPGLTAFVLGSAGYPTRADRQTGGVVTDIWSGDALASAVVPRGAIVLLSSGDAADRVREHAALGSVVRLDLEIGQTRLRDVELAVTGVGWLVHDGLPYTRNWGQYNFAVLRHPRTAIAWNHTHWFLVVIDGRSHASMGMTFEEMADFLIDTLGVDEALNLDGGGSSTCVVDGRAMNCTSDGRERPVANALLLVREDRRTKLPLADAFGPNGRTPGWEDRRTYNAVQPFSPESPDGDGIVLQVCGASGEAESVLRGDARDRDYSVQADVYCEYRPDVAKQGFERYGLLARDAGRGALTSPDVVPDNAYALTFDSNDGRFRAGIVVDGVLHDYLDDAPLYRPASAWRRLRIECFGDRIRYWLDGDVIAVIHDPAHAAGRFGLVHEPHFDDLNLVHGLRADNLIATHAAGDFDGNGVVDAADMQAFDYCAQEPDVKYGLGDFCLDGDLDGDRDVDLRDRAFMKTDPAAP